MRVRIAKPGEDFFLANVIFYSTNTQNAVVLPVRESSGRVGYASVTDVAGNKHELVMNENPGKITGRDVRISYASIDTINNLANVLGTNVAVHTRSWYDDGTSVRVPAYSDRPRCFHLYVFAVPDRDWFQQLAARGRTAQTPFLLKDTPAITDERFIVQLSTTKVQTIQQRIAPRNIFIPYEDIGPNAHQCNIPELIRVFISVQFGWSLEELERFEETFTSENTIRVFPYRSDSNVHIKLQKDIASYSDKILERSVAAGHVALSLEYAEQLERTLKESTDPQQKITDQVCKLKKESWVKTIASRTNTELRITTQALKTHDNKEIGAFVINICNGGIRVLPLNETCPLALTPGKRVYLGRTMLDAAKLLGRFELHQSIRMIYRFLIGGGYKCNT